jgi:enoyl-CoA hydratase
VTGAAGLRVERVDRALVITIDRPEVRNALDLATATALAEAVDQLDGDDGLAVGVITGSTTCFCAGMDLKAFAATGERPEVPGRGFGFTRRPPVKPVMAAVEGPAFAGGFELVLACDLVVAASTAVFALPEARVGLLAASGGIPRLANRVPQSVAMELALTGRHMPANEAHRWGLVNRLVEPGEARDAALRLAGEVAAVAPLSARLSKQLVRSALMPWSELESLQDRLLDDVLSSPDADEGARAFVEKRPARWTGR